MTKTLVIVESPAKARTIAAFLGEAYLVESSIGHVRDLPKKASDVPAVYKGSSWARLGVDINNDFKPLYVINADKRSQIAKLRKLLKTVSKLLLATDEDREGESIAWHLLEVLKPQVPVERLVFHEITQRAIRQAIANPRQIDRRLVDAQETRRILDRLYGYEVSPVLWKKIMPRLSAGRVQSVATRMIVERERQRMRFKAASYWNLQGFFAIEEGPSASQVLTATLVAVDGARLVTGKDFDEQGQLKAQGSVLRLNEQQAGALAEELAASARCSVSSVVSKPYTRSPAPPFMTSTLQQEAGRKLRFSAMRTMKAAQRLYENGYITYMRTDSATLSATAIRAAREQIATLYGGAFLPPQPRIYKSKVKNAQEAHEAIRPAGDRFRLPADVANHVGPDEAKIYELVWKRTLASQMTDARGERVQLRVLAVTDSRRAEFAAGGHTITFPGFLRAYVEGSDDPAAELDNHERHLPNVTSGQRLVGREFSPAGHETQPPPRFTEASLVKHLEELGVGRPSTYAAIVGTILERGYIWKRATMLVPSFKAFAVTSLLQQHFTDLVDYAFTARMEDELDNIAKGHKQAVPWLKRFYFGPVSEADKQAGSNGVQLSEGLRAMVTGERLSEIDARAVNTLPLGVDEAGREVVVRVGRYGPYVQRADESASVPEDLAPDELTVEKALELLNTPSDRVLGVHPETGQKVFVRAGKFGPYVQLGEPQNNGGERPKTISLLTGMSRETVTLDDALRLLSLPRTLGTDPEGVPITVQSGRYGPYVARGPDRRSLASESQLFSLSLGQALELLAQPRQRGRQAKPEPIRELSVDPVSGKTIVLFNGRFGPYVTDGETNASLRRGDSPDTITAERAQELLQLRRERGPAKRRRAVKRKAAKTGAKKTAAKKTAAKKTAAKKTAAKKATKKTAAKKTGA